MPTGTRGRVLALGITVLLLAAVWLGAVAPLLDWHAARSERLAQRTALAARMAAVAETLPRLRQEAVAVGGAPPALLEGTSDSLAGAALQSQVQEMASRAGITLGSAELLPAEAAGRYRRLSLRLSVNGSWPALIALLQALEEGTPRMLVDELQVRDAPSIAPGAGRPVAASLTVIAFRAGGEAPAR
nr:type II secretion system protein GspM [Pararoseomonas indoligenes]